MSWSLVMIIALLLIALIMIVKVNIHKRNCRNGNHVPKITSKTYLYKPWLAAKVTGEDWLDGWPRTAAVEIKEVYNLCKHCSKELEKPEYVFIDTWGEVTFFGGGSKYEKFITEGKVEY